MYVRIWRIRGHLDVSRAAGLLDIARSDRRPGVDGVKRTGDTIRIEANARLVYVHR